MNPLLVDTASPPIPAAQAWAAAYDGRLGPLINLAQAVPDRPPPADFLARLARAAGEPEHASYGPILGDLPLREALAADIAKLYAGDVRADDVVITAGCNQAFFVIATALARAGDEIVLPAPWYFNHKMTLDMLGIVARPLACLEQNGFVPRVEDARVLLCPNTRGIVLVSPNNPTGATYPDAVLQGFLRLAREAGIPLVLDETYRDFLPEGMGPAHGLFTDPAWRDTLVHLYSFSKSYAVPGHRLGALAAAPERIEQIGKVLDCMTICPPRAAQAAVTWGVEGIAAFRREARLRINARAARFRAVIERSPGWSIAASGAYFAYVRHPFNQPGDVVAERLAREVGVLALPGSFFGPGQEQHLRFAFANVDDARIDAVASRLATFA